MGISFEYCGFHIEEYAGASPDRYYLAILDPSRKVIATTKPRRRLGDERAIARARYIVDRHLNRDELKSSL